MRPGEEGGERAGWEAAGPGSGVLRRADDATDATDANAAAAAADRAAPSSSPPPRLSRATALPPPLASGPSPFDSGGPLPAITFSSNRADVDVGELVALLRTAAAAERLGAPPAAWPRNLRGSNPPLSPHWFDADERGECLIATTTSSSEQQQLHAPPR